LSSPRQPTLPPSLVFLAFSGTGPTARAALATLYETYYEPVRAYIERWRYGRGYGREQIEDLMHEFFSRRIEKMDLVKNWDPERVRFRTWLFAALNHFLLSSRKGEQRDPLAALSDEPRYEGLDARTPEDALSHAWAHDWMRVLIKSSNAKLRAKYERRNRLTLYLALSPYLALGSKRDEHPPYASLSQDLRKSEGALRVDVLRMRELWKVIFWEEVRQTVPDSDVENEIRCLIEALGESDASVLIGPEKSD
jgi:DNA-directed RNA polymerase specialized sigma24 family protein